MSAHMHNNTNCLTGLFLFLILSVHNVGATNWVADQGQESDGQAEKNGR